MELLAPAGGLSALKYAYTWGADAVYIGLSLFSLRARAEGFSPDNLELSALLSQYKGSKKLYLALNIYFHNKDLDFLSVELKKIQSWPIDGFILSEPAILPLVQEYFPSAEFHLSTQANCTNWRAAKMYRDMGFSRIVPARELSLLELKEIKQKVPGLELEVFAHGAMCLAYAGRCILSAEITGRSANRGDCAHNCRWHYRLSLEESERSGDYMDIECASTASGSYSLLLSSKDLSMIDHIEALADAGVDALKIEGRVKSLCYTSLVSRAYRWALDHRGRENPYKKNLYELSHRDFGTGFFFDRHSQNIVETKENYQRDLFFMGTVEEAPFGASPPENSAGRAASWGPYWAVSVKNTIDPSRLLYFDGPNGEQFTLQPHTYRVLRFDGTEVERIANEHGGWLQISQKTYNDAKEIYNALAPYWLIRA